MTAIISEDGKYRYVLRRSLGSPLRWYRPMLFIMLNPSTADAETDDPTIRRCMAFAKREGCTHLNVVNLFALRATDPKELRKAIDPIGPENDFYLDSEINNHKISPIVAAWGTNKFAIDRARQVTEKYGPFLSLGLTKWGMPRHPLYVKQDAELVRFSVGRQ